MREAILAVDVGTTSVKAAVIEIDGFTTVAKASERARIRYPRPGWAEVDAEELWRQVSRLSRRVVEEVSEEYRIAAVGFTAYLASPIPVDDEINPLYPIMLWLDTRAAGKPEELWKGFPKIAGYNVFDLIRLLWITGGAPGKTGKDTISKIRWLKDYEPEVYRSARYILDARGYLAARATGKPSASPDEAGLTWLADTRSLPPKWHKGLISRFGIDEAKLPPILDSTRVLGGLTKRAAEDLGLEPNTPVIVGSGDLTAAAIGAGAVSENEVHIYIGTSSWIAAHVSRRLLSVRHYIGSIPSANPGYYILVAEQEVAGAAIDWALNVMGFKDYREFENMAAGSEPGAKGLVFAPWLFGERSPVDNPSLRGLLFNISLDHGRGDVARAVVEGVALNIGWSWKYFTRLLNPGPAVRAVGGACRIKLLCKILAAVVGRRVEATVEPENASLRGVAVLASTALSRYGSIGEAAKRIRIAEAYEPRERKLYSSRVELLEKIYDSVAQLYH